MSSRGRTREKVSATPGTKAPGTPSAVSAATVKGLPDIEIDTAKKDRIPGKISDKEWNDLVYVDDGVETVLELVEDVVERASNIIFERFIASEIFPYAVEAARKNILKMIALEFVARDEGEKNTDTDPLWLPDEPPAPPPIDSWAEGIIPLASPESLHSLMDALETIHVHHPVADVDQQERRHTKATITSISSSDPSSNVPKPAPKPTPKRKKKAVSLGPPTTLPHMAPPARHSHPVTETKPPRSILITTPHDNEAEKQSEDQDMPQLHSNRRAQLLQSPLNELSMTPFGLKPVQLNWMKGVRYDEKGRIVEMVKLDPTKFPSHSTKPKVSIVYPPRDAIRQGFIKQRAKFKSLDSYPTLGQSHGRRASLGKSKHHSYDVHAEIAEDETEGTGMTTQVVDARCFAGKTDAVMPSDAGLSKKDSGNRFPSLPTLPAMVDTIDPVPGVVIREGGRTVRGPAPFYRHSTPPTGSSIKPLKSLGKDRRGVADGMAEGVEPRMVQKHYRHSSPVAT